MINYVRGTYLLLCGKHSKQVKDIVESAYMDAKTGGFLLPPPPSSMCLRNYFNFRKFYDRVKIANVVQGKVLDPYNVYCSIIDIYKPDIDFHDEDFTWNKK
jgi:hypothetical protein